jgi:hypothetical protein
MGEHADRLRVDFTLKLDRDAGIPEGEISDSYSRKQASRRDFCIEIRHG